MSKQTELKALSDVVKAIKKELGRLLGSNITVAIVSADGTISYIDNEMKKFSDFINSFAKENFQRLSLGDHSLPLSGTSIAFFKISQKSLVILNSDKGPVGQLLAFKGQMQKYAEKIDKCLEAVTEEEDTTASASAAVRVPVLTTSIANKKFEMDEAKVLNLINGENTVSDISKKTGMIHLKVDEILRKYQKKGWIKVKRLVIGTGKEEVPGIKAGSQPTGVIPLRPALKSTSETPPPLKSEVPPIMPSKTKAPTPITPSPPKSVPSPELPQIPKPTPKAPSYTPPQPSTPSPLEPEETVLVDLFLKKAQKLFNEEKRRLTSTLTINELVQEVINHLRSTTRKEVSDESKTNLNKILDKMCTEDKYFRKIQNEFIIFDVNGRKKLKELAAKG